jgi:DNA translocase FtsK/SpoIIIE-like protein
MMADNKFNSKVALSIAGASVIPIEALAAIGHGGLVGAALGAAVSAGIYVALDEYNKAHPGSEEGSDESSLPSQHVPRPEDMTFWYKLTHGKDARGEVIDAGQDETSQDEENKDPRFIQPTARDTGGVKRLTIDEIVAHTKPNSFTIWIGLSLTKDGNPAIQINFYKQHFKFIGISQRGKTSMVAAFIEIVTRTHDPKHVQLILLDMEDQTSNLFADLPHVLKMRTPNGETFRMHARNEQQVLQYLVHAVVIAKRRYQIVRQEGIAALKKMPVILVYIEEFLRLKAYFKAQLKTAKDKEQAESDYATLMYCIDELAGRGLKSRVQLLMCAQFDYADDDFREALGNIDCGFSFCVAREAAMSAGFTNAALLTRNAKEKKVGQAVVETPDCNDLVLAPEYDLEAKLEAWQEANEGLGDEPEAEQLEDNSPTAEDGDNQTQKIKLALVEKNKQADQELERAVNAFLEGATTLDDMQAAMGYKSQYQARQIMPRVKAEIKKRETVVNG